MTTSEITKIVADHALWLQGQGGQRANFAKADLEDANLCGLDLREANLCKADLRRADLSGANFGMANFCMANLRRADLRWADLCGAGLREANLCEADLREADLREADLREAELSRADLREATLPDLDIPIVPDIDAAILRAIESGGELDMKTWHTCDTTHCRAGWAITLAGDAGRKLEAEIGTNAAAALIYAVSRPGQLVPDWYATNEDAMADIRACAAAQQ